MSKTPESIARDFAISYVCPTGAEPSTPYEIGQVKNLSAILTLAIREAIQATARRAAEIASTWPCHCVERYKTKVPHHGSDCENDTGVYIAEKIEAEFGVEGMEGKP